jgi:hypothetical protein
MKLIRVEEIIESQDLFNGIEKMENLDEHGSGIIVKTS